jgi:hypothetical protein
MYRDGDGQVWLVATETNGKGGYEPGVVVRQTRRMLAPSEWTTATALLESAGFWGMPAWARNRGNNGAEWIVEVRLATSYHVVDRWNARETAIGRVGLFFLSLARLNLRAEDVY